MVPSLSCGCPSPPLAGECVCLGRLFLSCRAAAPQFSRRSVDARRRRSRVSACVSRLSLSCRAAAPQVRHCCAVGAQCRWCLLRAAALSCVSCAPPSVPPPSAACPPQCFPSAAVLPPLSGQPCAPRVRRPSSLLRASVLAGRRVPFSCTAPPPQFSCCPQLPCCRPSPLRLAACPAPPRQGTFLWRLLATATLRNTDQLRAPRRHALRPLREAFCLCG